MELYQEILLQKLANQRVQLVFPELKTQPDELVEGECCRMLEEIRDVLNDYSRSDGECCCAIEEIIRVFERRGVRGINRHDFG